jgi:hypothetical protein
MGDESGQEAGTASTAPPQHTDRLLKKLFSAGCSKTSRCKAREILRNEAYMQVRWLGRLARAGLGQGAQPGNDEG